MSEKKPPEPITPEQARNRRNIAIGLGLTAFILLVFFVTMARIKANLGG